MIENAIKKIDIPVIEDDYTQLLKEINSFYLENTSFTEYQNNVLIGLYNMI